MLEILVYLCFLRFAIELKIKANLADEVICTVFLFYKCTMSLVTSEISNYAVTTQPALSNPIPMFNISKHT